MTTSDLTRDVSSGSACSLVVPSDSSQSKPQCSWPSPCPPPSGGTCSGWSRQPYLPGLSLLESCQEDSFRGLAHQAPRTVRSTTADRLVAENLKPPVSLGHDPSMCPPASAS